MERRGDGREGRWRKEGREEKIGIEDRTEEEKSIV